MVRDCLKENKKLSHEGNGKNNGKQHSETKLNQGSSITLMTQFVTAYQKSKK
jgi:hypothetical protein